MSRYGAYRSDMQCLDAMIWMTKVEEFKSLYGPSVNFGIRNINKTPKTNQSKAAATSPASRREATKQGYYQWADGGVDHLYRKDLDAQRIQKELASRHGAQLLEALDQVRLYKQEVELLTEQNGELSRRLAEQETEHLLNRVIKDNRRLSQENRELEEDRELLAAQLSEARLEAAQAGRWSAEAGREIQVMTEKFCTARQKVRDVKEQLRSARVELQGKDNVVLRLEEQLACLTKKKKRRRFFCT